MATVDTTRNTDAPSDTLLQQARLYAMQLLISLISLFFVDCALLLCSTVSTFQPASDDEKEEEEEEEQPKQSKKKRKANADADDNEAAEPSSKKKKAKSPSSSASAAAPSTSKGVASSSAVPPPRQQESPPEDDFGFTRASGSRGGVKRTEEGFKIYAIDDLRMGLSKNTPLCPIDCECCF